MQTLQKSFRSSRFFIQAAAILIGCSGLTWAVSEVSRAVASDNFARLEGHLLRFETFGLTTSLRPLQSSAAQELSSCDSHAQRALLLLEIPLVDAALRSGDVMGFDRHIRSLETRSLHITSCAPRDALAWLVLFGLRLEHGELDERSFDLLQLSYDVSPNEAWIGVRRIAVAIPVLLAVSEPVRQRILTEFRNLVRNGFLEIPASSYLRAPAPVRAMLQAQLDGLDSAGRKAFSEALASARK